MIDDLQNRVQEIINSLESGKAWHALRAALAAIAILGLFGLYAFTQFRGLRDPEAMRMADVARNVADGRGCVTHCIRPFDLWFLETHGRPGPAAGVIPDLLGAPLFPALVAAGLHLVRPSFDAAHAALYAPEWKVIVPLCFLCTLATAWLLYRLGRALFGGAVAALALALYALGDNVLAAGISGRPTALSMLLALGALVAAREAALRIEGRTSLAARARPFVLSALGAALGVLADYSGVVTALAVALYYYLAVGPARWRVVALFALLVAAGVAPWLLHNVSVTGAALGAAPYEALRDTAYFAGDQLARSLHPSVNLARALKAVELNFWSGLARIYAGEFWLVAGGLLTAFFVLSFFYRFVRDDAHALRWSAGAGLVGMTLYAAAGGRAAAPLLQVFLPLVVLYGAAFFFRLLDLLELTVAPLRASLIFLVVALSALPLLLTLMTQRPGIPYPPYYPPLNQEVARLLDEDEWLCSDIPEATAWYGARASLLLPARMDDFYRVHDFIHPIAGLYLTSRTANRPYVGDLIAGSEKDWLPLLNQAVPEGFPLTHGIALPPGHATQLFLTDRVRWRE